VLRSLRPFGLKNCNDFVAPGVFGHAKRREALIVFYVWICASGKQSLDRGHMTIHCRQVQMNYVGE
jgi:hypothetical protein